MNEDGKKEKQFQWNEAYSQKKEACHTKPKAFLV